MGVFDRVERRLERTVNGVFARAFKADVQPVEIASAIRKAMDDRAVTPSRGHVLVPNVFTVSLARNDYERLAEFEDDIIDELVVAAEEHVDSQRYSPAGPVSVMLEQTEDLDTGVFRVRPSKSKHVSARHVSPGGTPPGKPQGHTGGPYAEAPASAAGADPDDFNPYGVNPHDAAAAHEQHAAPATAPPPSGQAPAAGGSRRTPTREEPRTPAPRRTRPGDRPYLASRDDRFLLIGAINVIGRDEDSDIIFDDPGISRRHSEIRVTTDGPHLIATVRDLGSTNGTFVNGDRVSSQRLADGDRVTIGRTTVTYHAGRS